MFIYSSIACAFHTLIGRRFSIRAGGTFPLIRILPDQREYIQIQIDPQWHVAPIYPRRYTRSVPAGVLVHDSCGKKLISWIVVHKPQRPALLAFRQFHIPSRMSCYQVQEDAVS